MDDVIDDDAVYTVKGFNLLAFRMKDRSQYGLLLSTSLDAGGLVRLALTVEQATALRDEIENTLPIARRRDA